MKISAEHEYAIGITNGINPELFKLSIQSQRYKRTECETDSLLMCKFAPGCVKLEYEVLFPLEGEAVYEELSRLYWEKFTK